MKNIQLFIVFILLFTSCDFNKKTSPDKNLKKSEIQELKSVDVIMEFRYLKNLEWDQVLILSPQTDVKKIENKYRTSVANISDIISKKKTKSTSVVFLKNRKPLKHFKIPLSEGKFHFNDTLISKETLNIGIDEDGMFVLY